MKKLKYEICLFDLDGTLTDSQEGIINSVKNALSHFGITAKEPTELRKFIGPPLKESFSKIYGFSEEETLTAIVKYREYFAETGIFENKVYEGIPELLKKLREEGKTLGVATSKPEVFAKRILEKFEIMEYFEFIAGSELDGARSRKSEVINYALDNLDPLRSKVCVMIGDREHDVIGAKEAGVQSVGVAYGYGSYNELKSAGAKTIADSVEDLFLKLT